MWYRIITVILYHMTDLMRIESAVAALPSLEPAPGTGPRYGPARLTASWLAELAPHTRTSYFRDLAHFLDWCRQEGLDPRQARPADIGQYRAALEHPGPGRPAPAAASVHRRLAALSSWYRYLLANSGGEMTSNPVAGIRRPRVDRDASTTAGLTTDQVRALLDHADAQVAARQGGRQDRYLASLRDRALLRLLADLGMRVGEALRLEVSALSYNQGRRTLRYLSKGGKQRERPLSAHALAAIDSYLAARAETAGLETAQLTGPLFATRTASRLDEPAAFRMVRRLAREAGLPAADRLSPHSLRHAFATNARELGVALEDVQDAMGHADTRTTRRYDRARHALHRDPALRLGDLYSDR